MVKIEFAEPSTEDWQKWKLRCQKATLDFCDARTIGDCPTFDEALYKAMWKVYLSPDGPFHGKCAYCESAIDADQPGDIDHFRPKGEVRDLEGAVVSVGDEHGNFTSHPGYYWLAYDWRNLLPACADCNRPSKKKTKGTRVGKGSRFPVANEYAVSAGAEDHEQPLLINPADPDEEPSLHMEFDDLGILFAKSERGAVCERVFGLNMREALVRKRKEAFYEAFDAVLTLIDATRAADRDRLDRTIEKLQAFKMGHAPYSAPARSGMGQRLAIQLPRQSSLVDLLERLAHSPATAES
ncbi:MAG TPA: hypothetical protein VGO56_04290 [Pyrinomonadaceae bacterium]|jgi:hypothetical protein|nr:hypothetical protein [Pyrinomonadaceae bacterium]